jgi:hypothetical protein
MLLPRCRSLAAPAALPVPNRSVLRFVQGLSNFLPQRGNAVILPLRFTQAGLSMFILSCLRLLYTNLLQLATAIPTKYFHQKTAEHRIFPGNQEFFLSEAKFAALYLVRFSSVL